MNKLALSATSLFISLSAPCFAGTYLPTKVALIQASGDQNLGQVDDNTAALTQLADAAVQAGAKIIVFPEGSTTGYEETPDPDVTRKDRKRTWCAPGELTALTMRFRKEVTCVDPTPIAEPVPSGKTTSHWARYAIQNQVYVVFDVLELVPGQGGAGFARTAVIVGPKGYLDRHRKASRWQNEESIGSVLGGPTVIKTPYGKFGFAICSGVFSNDLFTAYGAMDLNAIIFPAHWVPRDYPGFQGPSGDSFDFLAKWRKLDFLAADDSGSGRTGYYKADGSTVSRLNAVGETRTLLVDIAY